MKTSRRLPGRKLLESRDFNNMMNEWTRNDIEKAISELRTFPRFLTDELLVLRDEAIDAAWALVSGADPVEAKAQELYEATDDSIWSWATARVQTQDMYRRIAEHVLWQEGRHVD